MPDVDPDELDRFRCEARAWLETVAEPLHRPMVAPSAIVAEWSPDEEQRRLDEARRWQRTKFDAGWAGIAWPRRHGGRGLTPLHALIFAETEARFDVPRDALIVGLGWCGPAVMALGSDAQRDRFLPPLLRGDEVWCQLFSEPSAGSDLAGLETSAVRDGDEWVITGQKAWTTFAHRADWGLCIARHDSSASKHRGLTAFLVDMHDDRVTASPIRQMTGSANFNVVHLDEVRVPDAQRIGEVGGGWQMVVTTFMFERSAGLLGLGDSIDVLVELARRTGRASDEHVRDRLATLHARARVVTWAFQRSVAALAPGRVPGPEGSIAKLSATLLLSDVYEMGISLLGAGGMMTGSDARDDGEWQAAFLGAPGLRIGGGTDAVQRTIIGDRILGLPAEPRPDKSRPFSEVVNRLGISRGPGV